MKLGRLANIASHRETPPGAYGNLLGSEKAPNACTGTWTDERVELLKKLWQDGLSASQIAKRLGGVTRNACIGKVHRLGLTGREAPYKPGGQKGVPKPPRQEKRFRLKQPPEVPAPIKEPKPVADATLAKPWLERRFGECAAPIAGHGADVMSCCNPVRPDAPYCEAHCRSFYAKPATDAQRRAAARARLGKARKAA